MSHNTGNDITPRSRRREDRTYEDDESTSAEELETLSHPEIPDDVLHFPGVSSSSSDAGLASSRVSSTADEAPELSRPRNEAVETMLRRSRSSLEQYSQHSYNHQQQPHGHYQDTNYDDGRAFTRSYHDVVYDGGELGHQYENRFTFSVIDVTRAVEHLLELALIQTRRVSSGRSQPSERERQLRMNAPFLLTYAARRELQTLEGARYQAMSAFTRYVSEMVHQSVVDAHVSIE
ncbi:hypothetical protein K4F52_003535 [Lecanicillium sp. MT-2017a]|nr:hypothetical protein K4F52_003535 [Lecanicillium sp. MT-2017a]